MAPSTGNLKHSTISLGERMGLGHGWGEGGGGAGDNICKLSAEIKPHTVDCCSFKSGCIQILSHPPAFISFMEFLPNPTGVLSISLSAPNGAESKQQESSSMR